MTPKDIETNLAKDRLALARMSKIQSFLARQGARLRNIRPAQKTAPIGRMFTLTKRRSDKEIGYHARLSQPLPEAYRPGEDTANITKKCYLCGRSKV